MCAVVINENVMCYSNLVNVVKHKKTIKSYYTNLKLDEMFSIFELKK